MKKLDTNQLNSKKKVVKEEPKVENKTLDEPKVENKTLEEPKVENKTLEEPKVENKTSSDPKNSTCKPKEPSAPAGGTAPPPVSVAIAPIPTSSKSMLASNTTSSSTKL